MEQVVTAEEIESRTDCAPVQDLVPAATEEVPTLQPLLTFACSIPEGWKDAIYGKDGTGSASADNDWTPESEGVNSTR